METDSLRPNTLVLTTDLPFFPGKMGCDFFNLRHLAQRHAVGVVGPLHEFFSRRGRREPGKFPGGQLFLAAPGAADRAATPAGAARRAAGALGSRSNPPNGCARWLLRLLGLHRQPADAYVQVATLSNCAPQLLAALAARPWQTLVLIQTNTAPWLDYLPAHLAKLVYFHDVRSDSLRRGAEHEPDPAVAARQFRLIPAVAAQEARVCREADIVGFVSDLDERRALDAYAPAAETGVAPLPVDTDYFHPAAADWPRDPQSIVALHGPPRAPAQRGCRPLLSWRPSGRASARGCRGRCSRRWAACRTSGCWKRREPWRTTALSCTRTCPTSGPISGTRRPTWCPCASAEASGRRSSRPGPCRCRWFARRWPPRARAPSTASTAGRRTTPAAFAARVAGLLDGTEPAPRGGGRHGAGNRARLQFDSRRRHAFRGAGGTRAAHSAAGGPTGCCSTCAGWRSAGPAASSKWPTNWSSALSRLDHRNAYRMLLSAQHVSTNGIFPAGSSAGGSSRTGTRRAPRPCTPGWPTRLARELRMQPVLTPPMRALRAYRKMDFDWSTPFAPTPFPTSASFPTVLTALDLQHVHYPEFFTPRGLEGARRPVPPSCAAARHILCISEFTRQDLHRSYGVPLEKMTTVWIIPSRAAWLPLDPARSRALLAGMGITRALFLFPRARLAAQEPRAARGRLRPDRQGLARRHAPRVHRTAVCGGPPGAGRPSPNTAWKSAWSIWATVRRWRCARSTGTRWRWCFRRCSRGSGCRSPRR